VLIEPIERHRQLGQGWSSRLLQRLLLELLTDPGSQREVTAAKRAYADRRRAIIKRLAGEGLYVEGDDGINIWVPVLDEVAALQSLAAGNIGAAPGSPFRVEPTRADTAHIRVTIGLLADHLDDVATAVLAASRAGGLISR
jgi:DNA-binding transcriptional MocR family regulator